MEFGENLKNARERKGMTQQSLADQLFVTRQAVSKWERGVRYPDILTTKCIAGILDISIDSLVSDEEVSRFSEQQSLTEQQKGGKGLCVLYALLAVMTFLECVASFGKILMVVSDDGWSTAVLFWHFLCPGILCLAAFLVSLFALRKAVVGEIRPRTAGLLGMALFFVLALKSLVTMAEYGLSIGECAALLLSIGMVFCISSYYRNGKSPLYGVILGGTILSAVVFVLNPIAALLVYRALEQPMMLFLSTILQTLDALTGLVFLALILLQTSLIRRKRAAD